MIDVYRFSERLMAMDDATWARHANPWSVYTRFTCLPLIALSIWSRVWLGWWSLLPLATALVWTWCNPRAFAPAKQSDGWAWKGAMGERLFLDRKRHPVPAHHTALANLLTLLSAIGGVILAYGLIVLDAWATIAGLLFTMTTKAWFVDRMVWLYEDVGRQASHQGA